MLDYQSVVELAAIVTALGGAWITVRKISRDQAKAKKEQEKDFLRLAREEDALLKTKLDAKIDALKSDLKNLESNVVKDLDHLKQNYTSEIKNLGEKIEALRDQLNSQHSQLVQLLTDMIKKRN